ncbi:Uncharacterised protein [Candidatus Tiddalikarchaeum anstoanum]|nr:Uncharacterised protein [Candidatus Tiddalikarchaeum anstoanum]
MVKLQEMGQCRTAKLLKLSLIKAEISLKIIPMTAENEVVISEHEFLKPAKTINSYFTCSLNGLVKKDAKCTAIKGELNFYVDKYCKGFLVNLHDLKDSSNPHGPYTINEVIEELPFDTFARLEVSLLRKGRTYYLFYDNYLYRTKELDCEIKKNRLYLDKILDGSCRKAGILKNTNEENDAFKKMEAFIVELKERKNKAFMKVEVTTQN